MSLKLLALTFDNTSRHRFWRLRPDKFATVWFVIRVTQFLSLNFHHLSLKIPKFSMFPNWHLKSHPVFNFKSCGWFPPKKKKKKKIKEFVKHCGWVSPKKKKKIHLSNIAAGYVDLITKIPLKIEFWKLKTPKICFQFP